MERDINIRAKTLHELQGDVNESTNVQSNNVWWMRATQNKGQRQKKQTAFNSNIVDAYCEFVSQRKRRLKMYYIIGIYAFTCISLAIRCCKQRVIGHRIMCLAVFSDVIHRTETDVDASSHIVACTMC